MKHKFSKEYRDIILRLKLARIEAGLTQKEASILLNRYDAYIKDLENFRRHLKVDTLLDLCRVYKKDILLVMKEPRADV